MSEEEKDKMRAMDNAITGLIRSMDNNEQIIDHNHKFICEKLVEFSDNNSRVLKLVHDTIRNLGILAANPEQAREAISRTVKEEKEKHDKSIT